MSNNDDCLMDYLNVPTYQNPFFQDIIPNKTKDKEIIKLAKKFHDDGYVIIDLNLDDILLMILITK